MYRRKKFIEKILKLSDLHLRYYECAERNCPHSKYKIFHETFNQTNTKITRVIDSLDLVLHKNKTKFKHFSRSVIEKIKKILNQEVEFLDQYCGCTEIEFYTRQKLPDSLKKWFYEDDGYTDKKIIEILNSHGDLDFELGDEIKDYIVLKKEYGFYGLGAFPKDHHELMFDFLQKDIGNYLRHTISKLGSYIYEYKSLSLAWLASHPKITSVLFISIVSFCVTSQVFLDFMTDISLFINLDVVIQVFKFLFVMLCKWGTRALYYKIDDKILELETDPINIFLLRSLFTVFGIIHEKFNISICDIPLEESNLAVQIDQHRSISIFNGQMYKIVDLRPLPRITDGNRIFEIPRGTTPIGEPDFNIDSSVDYAIKMASTTLHYLFNT